MEIKLPAPACPIRLQQASKFVLASQRTLSSEEHSAIVKTLALFLDTLSERESADLIAHVEHGLISPEEAQDLIDLAMAAQQLADNARHVLDTSRSRKGDTSTRPQTPAGEMAPGSSAREVASPAENARHIGRHVLEDSLLLIPAQQLDSIHVGSCALERAASDPLPMQEVAPGREASKHAAPFGTRLGHAAAAGLDPGLDFDPAVDPEVDASHGVTPPLLDASDPATTPLLGANDGEDGAADGTTPPRRPSFINVQVWHNERSVPQPDEEVAGKRSKAKAEWVIKLRWSDYADLDVVHEWEVSTQATPDKARANVTRQAARGRVSAEWAQEFARITADLDDDLRVGSMSENLYRTSRRPAGKSSNEREVFEGCWGTLALNSQRTAPLCLTLHFPAHAPIILTKFNTPNGTGRNAPGWMALYDPDGLAAAKRERAEVRRHLADQRKLVEHSPTTALGRLLEEFWRPMAEEVERLAKENVHLAANNVHLAIRQDELLRRVEVLEQDVAGIQYASRAPNDIEAQIRDLQWASE